jgi:hypothetical protein
MNTKIVLSLLGIFLLTGFCFFCQGDSQAEENIDVRGLTREKRCIKLIQKVSRNPLGKKVLALYKSTDGQTENENETLYHVQSHLINLGLTVEYWDIDAGIPPREKLQDTRAVISWFRGASMADPEAYLDFMDNTIMSGLKYIVIDNFGAYQYRMEQDKFVEPARLNLTLSKLGIWYSGKWTDDASVLEITDKDSAIVEANGLQDVTKSGLYYFFQIIDKDLDVYLSVKRTDEDLPPSPFVVTNRNGGFILSRYIYRMEGGQAKILIDFNEFLRKALFPRAKLERIGILTDLNHPQIKRICVLLAEQLKRTQCAFEVIEKQNFKKLVPGDLASYTTVALIIPNEEDLDPEVIADYQFRGGSLVSLFGGYFSNLAPYLASRPKADTDLTEGIGYDIKPGLLLSEGFVLKDDDVGWGCGNLEPAADAVILATDYESQQPLVWAAKDGRVLTWNWHFFTNPEFIGLAFESFLYVRPVGVAATLGFAHLFIDDCPLPMYNVKKEPLENMTDTEFYLDVWWPETKQLLDAYGIPSSAYIIFNYNAQVEHPFTGAEFFAAENMASKRLALKLLEDDVEMGFHGYNHVSLTCEETEVNEFTWPSLNNMIAALEEGKRYWMSMLPRASLPFAYVAPNNIISEEGIRAVHKVFPTIKIISMLHWGEYEEACSEMAPNCQFSEIYYFPRISSGYLNTYAMQKLIVAGASVPGVVNHFIHPDDVYDPDRSGGLTWEKMKSDFTAILDFINYHYPWIEWVDIREAYYRLLTQDEAQVSYKWDENSDGAQLTVTTMPGQLFRIRPNTYSLTGLDGAEIIYSYKSMPGIILKAVDKECVLSFSKK